MRRLPGSVHLGKILLIIGPVAVIATALHSVWHLQSVAGRPDPDHLSNSAEGIARLAEAYIARTITITGMLVNSPTINEALTEASRTPRNDKGVKDKDDLWKSEQGRPKDPYLDIAEKPASHFLADVTRAPGSPYREILVADRHGRLIAASNRTEDYDQADDDWWPLDLDHTPAACRHAPATCVAVEGVKMDLSAGAYGFSLFVPVLASGQTQSGQTRTNPVLAAGTPVGVLKAVIDPTELATLVKLTQLNPSIRVALVGESGSPIFGTEQVFAVPPKELQKLSEGSEAMVQLSEIPDQDIACIRRLTGAMGRTWYVVARSADRPPQWRWPPVILWSALALGMFIVAALAARVQDDRSRAADDVEAAR